MLRKFDHTTPLNDLLMEALFTRAAVQADPDAEDLLPQTEGWVPGVLALQALWLENLTLRMGIEARRMVANNRLDPLCARFGDQLLLAVNKDRESVRWKRYFKEAPSRFVRAALAEQTAAVDGWLLTQDPVLEPFRAELALWNGKARAALAEEPASLQATANLDTHRDEFARSFVADRDRLLRALAERAEEKGLDRLWPYGFFLRG